MTHTTLQRRNLLQMLAAGTLFPAVGHTQVSNWKPTQNIVYGIGVAPGGSVDIYARGVKAGLENLKLVNGQNIIADNKPGAAGLFILQQLKRNAGDAHHLATFHTGSIAGQITGILKGDIREFVPVCMLVEETTLVAVRSDSPLQTGKDLVASLKADPGKLRLAVAPILGQNTHLAIAKPLKTAGVDISKLTIAPFRSSAESVSALLGGHVDVVSATGPTLVPMLEAGRVRLIASAAPERGTGPLAKVPTWRELGVAADYLSYNGVLLAPGVNAEQIRYWEDALRQVARSPEWIALVERSGNKPIFKGYVDSHRYLQAEFKATQALINELGLTTS
jgi:putative tricarboxylic transport membrane protein